MTITKQAEVHFLLVIHHRFANATQVSSCKVEVGEHENRTEEQHPHCLKGTYHEKERISSSYFLSIISQLAVVMYTRKHCKA